MQSLKAKQNVLNQHKVGNYPMQCCPRGPTWIKTSFLPKFIKKTSQKGSYFWIMTLKHWFLFVHCKIIQKMMSETNIEQLPISYTEAVFGRCSPKLGVFKDFANFTGKSLFSKVFTSFIKNTLQHRYFSVEFAKFLRKPFSTENFRWFLLHVMQSVQALYSN